MLLWCIKRIIWSKVCHMFDLQINCLCGIVTESRFLCVCPCSGALCLYGYFSPNDSNAVGVSRFKWQFLKQCYREEIWRSKNHYDHPHIVLTHRSELGQDFGCRINIAKGTSQPKVQLQRTHWEKDNLKTQAECHCGLLLQSQFGSAFTVQHQPCTQHECQVSLDSLRSRRRMNFHNIGRLDN